MVHEQELSAQARVVVFLLVGPLLLLGAIDKHGDGDKRDERVSADLKHVTSVSAKGAVATLGVETRPSAHMLTHTAATAATGGFGGNGESGGNGEGSPYGEGDDS